MSDVVSGERAEDSSSLRSSNEPSIITFLHDVDNVSLQELHLVLVLRLVVIESSVAVKHDNFITRKCRDSNLRGWFRLPVGHGGPGPGEGGVGTGGAGQGLGLLQHGNVGGLRQGAVLEDGVSRGSSGWLGQAPGPAGRDLAGLRAHLHIRHGQYPLPASYLALVPVLVYPPGQNDGLS